MKVTLTYTSKSDQSTSYTLDGCDPRKPRELYCMGLESYYTAVRDGVKKLVIKVTDEGECDLHTRVYRQLADVSFLCCNKRVTSTSLTTEYENRHVTMTLTVKLEQEKL